jgi:hypothetical protein
MPKKLIVILILCCFFGGCGEHGDNCASRKKAIFKEGDKVSLRVSGDTGIIHRITKETLSGCKAPNYIYHVKIFNKVEKGHVVHRVPESDVLEFIEEPR